MLRLTAAEKIVVCLGFYHGQEDEVEAPVETSQEGLSSTLNLRRSHVSIALSGLKNARLVSERLSHVKLSPRRKKVYFLTDKGLKSSMRLRKILEEEDIILRDGAKEEKMKLKSLVKVIPGKPNLAKLLNMIKEGVFDIENLKHVEEGGKIDFSDPIPQVKYFFGREEELKRLALFLESREIKIFAIKGIAGIGKTTLLTKFASDLEGREVFMYRICEWTTLGNLLKRLSEFLAARGRRELRMHLKSRELPDIEEAVMGLSEDLAGLKPLLIFDDIHNSNENIAMLLKAMLDRLDKVRETKIIISGRTIPTFYSRREVVVKSTVEEIELKGLDKDSAREILKSQREDGGPDFVTAYKLTKGHPLFLELLALNGTVSPKTNVKRFVYEEIYSRLDKGERRLLGMASVFRYPMKQEVLVSSKDGDQDILENLVEKSLIHQSGSAYELHDILKEFFYSRLSKSATERNHLAAAKYYEGEDGPLSMMESIYHLVKGRKFNDASGKMIREGMSLIAKGYHEELLKFLLLFAQEDIREKDWIKILFLKGEILTMLGWWKGAQSCYSDALKLSEELDEKDSLAQAYYELGVMHYRRGEWKKALNLYEQSLGLSKSEGFKEREAKLYNTMGILYWRNNLLRKAAQYYKKSIGIYKKTGDLGGIAGAYNNLGILHWELKETDKALTFYIKSLRISQNLGDKRTVAILYNNIGEVYRLKKEREEALRYYRKSLELSKELEFKWQIAEVHRNLARLHRGKTRKDNLKKSLGLFTQLGAKKDVQEVKKMIKK
jgi:tetratricopeptide (TPR) repeat protein